MEFRKDISKNCEDLCRVIPTAAQRIKKDRLVDRKMDALKIKELSGVKFSNWKEKLSECTKIAINRMPKDISKMIHLHAWMDRIAHELTPFQEIRGKRNKIIYVLIRWSPSVYITLRLLHFISKITGRK